jgi:hypothetical protein
VVNNKQTNKQTNRYTVINLGPGEPWESGWQDRIECFKVSNPSTRVTHTQSNSFRFTVGLSYTRYVNFILPTTMAGSVRCTVTTNANSQVRELDPQVGVNTRNSDTVSNVRVLDPDVQAVSATATLTGGGASVTVTYAASFRDVSQLDQWNDQVELVGPGNSRRVLMTPSVAGSDVARLSSTGT